MMSPWQPTSEGVGFWWSSRPCRPEWLVTVGGGGGGGGGEGDGKKKKVIISYPAAPNSKGKGTSGNF